MAVTLTFEGEIWFWRGPAPWYFVTVPEEECARLRALSGSVTYGWGMIPVHVHLGTRRFYTALWPKDGRYIVPLRAEVRAPAGLDAGDVVRITLEVG